MGAGWGNRRRRRWSSIVAGVLVGCAVAAQPASAAVTEYPIASYADAPVAITTGSDGALWFSLSTDKIGRMSTNGSVREFFIPSGDFAGPVARGPDGAVWFGEDPGPNNGPGRIAGGIGRITTTGTVTEYALPDTFPSVAGITAGPDGAMWFTEFALNGSFIGRISTAGVVTKFPLPRPADSIAAGPDGALWFTEPPGGTTVAAVGRITPAGSITQYPLPDTGTLSQLGRITAGPDGALWMIDTVNPRLLRISTAGAFSDVPIPGPAHALATGRDGALWFGYGKLGFEYLGRVTPTGTVSSIQLQAEATDITAGPDGAMWFTEPTRPRGQTPAIGRIGSTPSPPPPVRCHVPSLAGLGLSLAERRLRAAHCSLGSVKKTKAARRRHHRPLVVVAQSPRAGAVEPRGHQVAVTLAPRKGR